jgi:hypothetical protein
MPSRVPVDSAPEFVGDISSKTNQVKYSSVGTYLVQAFRLLYAIRRLRHQLIEAFHELRAKHGLKPNKDVGIAMMRQMNDVPWNESTTYHVRLKTDRNII